MDGMKQLPSWSCKLQTCWNLYLENDISLIRGCTTTNCLVAQWGHHQHSGRRSWPTEEQGLSTSPVTRHWWWRYAHNSNVCLKDTDPKLSNRFNLNSVGGNTQFTIEHTCQTDKGYNISVWTPK